ncbi:NACHT [Prionailurus iriomotensis]
MEGAHRYSREIFRKHLKEKYLNIGVHKCYHGNHIESRLLLVKEHGISEKTPCGIPQQDNFIDMGHVFDPDQEGCSSSQTVVLQGCAGIGKTAVVHKFMFDWAAGMVTPGRFDYLIYVNCREISHIANLSAADLITNTFQDIDGPILDVILVYPEKLLFILDGFPELQHPVGNLEEDLSANPQEQKPVETLLCSFVRKKLFPESSLLITARPATMKKLHSLLKQSIQAEIIWFTNAEKRAYFLSQFSGANAAMRVFYELQQNQSLDIMSSLPIISWMICSVLQSQEDGDRSLMRSLQTMTDVYLFYFSKCLKTLTGISVWKGQSCLWGLCSLAAEGLQNQQVLFEVCDLRRHGIGIEPMDLLHCLYEIQEEEYAEKIIGDLQSIILLQPSYTKMDILAMTFCVKSSHSHLSVSLKCQHLIGFEEEEQASAFMTPVFTLNQLYYFGVDDCYSGKGGKLNIELVITLLYIYFITEASESLRSFKLHNLPVSRLHLLCQALRNPCCKIKDLKLIFCHLTASCDSGMRLLLCASFLPESSEVVCNYLASVLICNPNLTELDLSENPLGDTGVKYLCEGLRHSNCKVEKLDLSTCYLTDASCMELSSFLQVSQTLKELFVFANTLGDIGVQHLCEGLQHAQGIIESLVLWTCHLTGECCQDLCNALFTNEYLRDLDLSDNALGDEGMQVLCEGLKHPSCKLQTLWLAECHLTDACCGALASVLNRNENLTLLDLSGNDLKDFGVQMLCDALIQPICKLQTFYIDSDHLHEETFRKMEALKMSKPGITW